MAVATVIPAVPSQKWQPKGLNNLIEHHGKELEPGLRITFLAVFPVVDEIDTGRTRTVGDTSLG